jgi:hypothetical protein
MEKRISASARNKKTIDRPFDMQFVHYKELTTLFLGGFWRRDAGKRLGTRIGKTEGGGGAGGNARGEKF